MFYEVLPLPANDVLCAVCEQRVKRLRVRSRLEMIGLHEGAILGDVKLNYGNHVTETVGQGIRLLYLVSAAFSMHIQPGCRGGG